ncbi:MAG: M23 family metallopeptidase [Patescibacteria group bacterium]
MAKLPILILIVFLLISSILFLYFFLNFKNLDVDTYNGVGNHNVGNNELDPNSLTDNVQEKKDKNSKYSPPIDDFKERVTKKNFGVYITPKTSPVQPEKFMGYHAGVDFETFSEEKDRIIEVLAFCEGKIEEKKYVNGYGGVLVESCQIEGVSATVLYGHLSLGSVKKTKGDKLTKGETIGILGKGFSLETDGERKHLHLSIRKGERIDFRGYVSSKKELENWIDPLTLL